MRLTKSFYYRNKWYLLFNIKSKYLFLNKNLKNTKNSLQNTLQSHNHKCVCLWICMCMMCICVCLHAYVLYVYLYVHAFNHLYICTCHMCIYEDICKCFCISLFSSMCASLYSQMYRFIYVYVYVYVFASTCMFVFVCLRLYLSASCLSLRNVDLNLFQSMKYPTNSLSISFLYIF